ncbi:MAG: hypothetical protein KAX49_14520 [Halanaerobiales bacterium]|nr:hypothetical protein [Halanaerobiales bacterium]
MRKNLLITLLLCLFLATLPSFAEENLLIQNSGGGGMIEVLQIDMVELNSLLTQNGYNSFGSTMIIFGGGLLAQNDKNLRYSNFGASGSLSSTAENGQYANLSFTHGGFGLDKIFTLSDFIGFSLGGSASLGKYKLELIKDTATDIEDGISNSYQTVMTVPVFMIKPQVGASYSIKRYMDLEVKAGYYYSHILGNWKQGKNPLEGNQPLEQMHGFSLLVNLNFGF